MSVKKKLAPLDHNKIIKLVALQSDLLYKKPYFLSV